MITDKLQMIEIRGIMSDKITLLYNVQNEVTVLPNKFIDEYMIKADGEYVKIYLLILRLQGMGLPVDVERIADYLELTRKDVLRALSYSMHRMGNRLV